MPFVGRSSNNHHSLDPAVKYFEIVNSAIESFRKQQLLSNSTASKLTLDEVRAPQFHIFPKVHNINIPGRHVVSSVKCHTSQMSYKSNVIQVECHTSKISKFVDRYLQLHAKSLPSCIKDTSDFINRINGTRDINKETLRATLDVKSLYTNIPNREGM